MKHLALIAVLGNIVADALFFAYLPEKQAYVLSFVLAFVSVLIYLVLLQIFKRRYWKREEIGIDDPRFQDFFWELGIADQDWYVENILTPLDIQTLITRYEEEVKGIWAEEMPVADKIEKSRIYVSRINLLLTMI